MQGCGVADGPAGHRDQGRRHLGLHPDQRHLHHGRPGVPGVGPVLLRVRPAINVGNSVSRVGGAAQIRAMRSVAGTLRPTWPSSGTWKRSPPSVPSWTRCRKPRWTGGYRLTEVLKQPQNSRFPSRSRCSPSTPQPRATSTTSSSQDVRRFETELIPFFRSNHADLLHQIRTNGPTARHPKLDSAIADFKELFSLQGFTTGIRRR